MSPTTIYLVTGANRPRGIGLGLVAEILAKHDSAFVYAAVREPAHAAPLEELKVKYPGRIAVVRLISADTESNVAVAKEIKERHGRVDTVIANAALMSASAPVHETKPVDMEEHFRVNVLGPVVLFQSVYEILKQSANPRFIPITSFGGSIGGPYVEMSLGSMVYSSTKAALNWISRKIHFENPWLIAFPLSPGGVSTDMFDYFFSTDHSGSLQAWMDKYGALPAASEAAASMLKLIDESTREKEGGEFMNVDGTKVPW